MVHYQESYIIGKIGEEKVLPIIKEFFKRDIQQSKNQYDKYDFFDNKYNYECKTRLVNKNTYIDTMITFNKLKDDDKPLILLFNFLDKLCYIKYNKEKFKKYRINKFSRAQLKNDEKHHIYIDISDLKDITDYN
jgi:hypothetical protein